MRFEYNGNLSEEDRINLVVKEIIDKYPQISIEKAKDAAMLEGRISSNKTSYDELNRLYNLMLVNCDNKDIIRLIYKDFLNLLNKDSIEENSNYFYLVEGIKNYIQGYTEFPFLSDYQ